MKPIENQLTRRQKERFEQHLLEFVEHHKTDPTKSALIHQTVYVLAQALYEKHNCDAYFITLTVKQTSNLMEQWYQLGEIITEIMQGLDKQFLIAGAAFGLEMHKKTSNRSLRGKDLKAGYPHIHFVLWTYHDFLNPTINDLRAFFIAKGFDTNVKTLKETVDVKKAILYTIKEAANENLREICNQAINSPYSAFIWGNHIECHPLFMELTHQLNSTKKQYRIGFKCHMKNLIPTIKRVEDQKLKLAMLFRKIFELKKWAIFDHNVYRPIEGARYTWEKWITLENWISSCYQQNLPPQFLTMLGNSAHWLALQGAMHKNAPKLDIFPELIIETQFVEFYDGVYEFTRGVLLTEDFYLSPFTSCTNHHPTNFHELEPPLHILGFLFTLITSEAHEGAALDRAFNPKEDPDLIKCKKQRKEAQEHHQSWIHRKMKKIIELLSLLGGIFHPEAHRKGNPALFLLGEPSSYKTFLIKNFLKATLGEHQVKVISRVGGRFTFGFLAKNNKFTILMDDVEWDQLGMSAGEFLNLLDRNPIAAEQKYEKGTQIQHQGALLLTGNSPLSCSTLDGYDNGLSVTHQSALEKRISTIQLHAHKNAIYVPNEGQLNYIKEQSINLSILANAVYLKDKQIKNVHKNEENVRKSTEIAHKWDNFVQNSQKYDKSHNLFERLGAKVFQHILDYLHEAA